MNLATYLKEKGIQTGIHYPIPNHQQPACSNTLGATAQAGEDGGRGPEDPFPSHLSRSSKRRRSITSVSNQGVLQSG